MYHKISKLSTKSLTETNSGKLITIISGDMFNVERITSVFAILIACPFVVLLCLVYVTINSGIIYAAFLLAVFLLCAFGQYLSNIFTRRYKAKEAYLSD
jgi:ABC-type transport system involved in cytochrome bd biosynthesis fused ATPase/permease subunit